MCEGRKRRATLRRSTLALGETECLSEAIAMRARAHGKPGLEQGPKNFLPDELRKYGHMTTDLGEES